MSEVIPAASACRTTISEAIQTAASNTLSFAADGWGCEQPPAGSGSKYVSAVHTTSVGQIVVTATGLGDIAIDRKNVSPAPLIGTALVTVSDGTKAKSSWRCGNGADGTDMPAKYLPGWCKG